MEKLLLIASLLITSSCYQMFDNAGCGTPSAQDKEATKWFYKNASIAVANLSSSQSKNYLVVIWKKEIKFIPIKISGIMDIFWLEEIRL